MGFKDIPTILLIHHLANTGVMYNTIMHPDRESSTTINRSYYGTNGITIVADNTRDSTALTSPGYE